MAKVEDPSKELRFSRGRQAFLFALSAILCFSVGVILLLVLATVYYEEGHLEEMPYARWWLYTPWLPMIGFGWLTWYCLRHPLLILSPIGVEIFPFWRPVKHFHLIEWGRIHEIESDGRALTLHYNAEHNAGVVISLAPLSKKSRILLMQAAKGVMDQRKISK